MRRSQRLKSLSFTIVGHHFLSTPTATAAQLDQSCSRHPVTLILLLIIPCSLLSILSPLLLFLLILNLIYLLRTSSFKHCHFLWQPLPRSCADPQLSPCSLLPLSSRPLPRQLPTPTQIQCTLATTSHFPFSSRLPHSLVLHTGQHGRRS